MAIKPSNEMFKPNDHQGKVMAARKVTIVEKTTQFGTGECAECGELAYESADGELRILTDQLIFNKALVRTLAAADGDEWIIGRLGHGLAKPGQSAAVLLVEMDDEETAKVEAALAEFDKSF